MRPAALRKRMPKVDGVSIPRSKFMVKAPLAKLALKPSPQAGARPIFAGPPFGKPNGAVRPGSDAGRAPARARCGILCDDEPSPGRDSVLLQTPVLVMRPTLPASVNHTAPSGPPVMPSRLFVFGTEYSLTTPFIEIRPMRVPSISVNHRSPSGPAAICSGLSGAAN